MSNSMLIFFGGILHIAFVIFHLLFWRLFKWKRDLRSLSPVNRSVMPVMNICLIIVFLTNALLSLLYTNELLTTDLGKIILLSISVFWLIRLVLQFLYFNFRTNVSIGLIIAFLTLTIFYIIPVFE